MCGQSGGMLSERSRNVEARCAWAAGRESMQGATGESDGTEVGLASGRLTVGQMEVSRLTVGQMAMVRLRIEW